MCGLEKLATHTTAIQSDEAIPPTIVQLKLGVREKLGTMESKGEVMDVDITR